MTRKKWLKKKDQKSSGNIITILHGFYFWRLFLQSSRTYVTYLFIYMVYSYIYYTQQKNNLFVTRWKQAHFVDTGASSRQTAVVASLGWVTEDGSALEEQEIASPPSWSLSAVAGARWLWDRGGSEGEEGRRRSFRRPDAGALPTLTPWRRAGGSRRGAPPRWQASWWPAFPSSCAPPWYCRR